MIYNDPIRALEQAIEAVRNERTALRNQQAALMDLDPTQATQAQLHYLYRVWQQSAGRVRKALEAKHSICVRYLKESK